MPEPHPGFYATSNARSATGHANEALTLAMFGRERDTDRQLASAERYLREALERVTAARKERAVDEPGRATMGALESSGG